MALLSTPLNMFSPMLKTSLGGSPQVGAFYLGSSQSLGPCVSRVLLTSTYVHPLIKPILAGYDATAHIAEEIKNPEVKAPWAISMGMLCTYVAGWLFNIVLCFVMGDISGEKSILHSPVQQPVAQIFYNILGKSGGIFYTVCAFIILKFGNFTAMQALTRTLFAFSRDGLVPFSATWMRIMPQTGIPIFSVWITVFWCIAINLIGLGSYPAITGVFNVCAIALDWSFCIPIFCKILFGKFTPGPWHLGKFSLFFNIYACLWTVFVSVIFTMPTTLPVAAGNVRYPILSANNAFHLLTVL